MKVLTLPKSNQRYSSENKQERSRLWYAASNSGDTGIGKPSPSAHSRFLVAIVRAILLIEKIKRENGAFGDPVAFVVAVVPCVGVATFLTRLVVAVSGATFACNSRENDFDVPVPQNRLIAIIEESQNLAIHRAAEIAAIDAARILENEGQAGEVADFVLEVEDTASV